LFKVMTKIVNDILDIPCLLKVQEQFYDDWHIVTNSLSSSLSSNLSLSSSLESIVALELDDGDDDIFYDALDEFLYTSTNNH
uniref:Ovule protein n=1 Tax=Parastrongyloides trichosuri TaxID=131310 RepID=A0A0N5A5B9_PARTI